MKRALLVASIACASIKAVAQIDNTALPCTSGPTYWPRGDFWALAPPANANPIPVYFEPTGPNGPPQQSNPLTIADLRAAIMGSFNTWATTACTGGTPNLSFKDAGDYSQSAIAGGCVTSSCRDPGDITNSTTGQFTLFRNVIYWVTDSTAWQGDSLTVALTWSTSVPAFQVTSNPVGAMLTSDMQFNGINIAFRVKSGASWSGCQSGTDNCFDIGTVSLHEAGHFIGLNHVQCSDAIMFPTRPGSTVITTLPYHEVAAVCAMYPPRGTVSTVAAPYELCTAASQCPSGYQCVIPADTGVTSSCQIVGVSSTCNIGWCAKPCTGDADCPSGHICYVELATTSSYCIPGLVTKSLGAPGGSDWCAPCSSGQDCQSGLCVNMGGHAYCVAPCAGASACPANFTCTPTAEKNQVCWPTDPTNCVPPTNAPPLNGICYQLLGTTPAFTACAPGLMCVAFKEHVIDYQNACVAYQEGDCLHLCSNDQPCSTYGSNLTCCYGVDAKTGACCLYGIQTDNSQANFGQCLAQSAGANATMGACFQIGQQNSPCVTPEQSVCDQGLGCFDVGSDANAAKCYAQCPNGNECGANQSCNSYADCAGNKVQICLNSSQGCCSAFGDRVPAGDVALTAGLWLPVVVGWRLRRRKIGEAPETCSSKDARL